MKVVKSSSGLWIFPLHLQDWVFLTIFDEQCAGNNHHMSMNQNIKCVFPVNINQLSIIRLFTDIIIDVLLTAIKICYRFYHVFEC